eukprot:jgi/Mesvir1/8183/Mv12482-RA.1
MSKSKLAVKVRLLVLFVTALTHYHGCHAVVDDAFIQTVRDSISSLFTDQPNLPAKFLRLSFHDCVGGCDGCVDLGNPDNNGLLIPINALEPVYDQFKANLSRADIWAIAGLEGARYSQMDGMPAKVKFRLDQYGRQDCGDLPTKGPLRDLPGANWDGPKVMGYFQQVGTVNVVFITLQDPA